MLIIGNVANAHYINARNNGLVEVLCLEESLDVVKKALFLTDPPIDKNSLSSTYLFAGTRYLIYNSSQMPIIKEILKTHCDVPERMKIVSPLITFAWTLMKSKYIHKFFSAWEENAIVCSTLYEKYMKHSSRKGLKIARTSSMMLTGCGALARGCEVKPYEYKAYTYFTRESLIDLYGAAISKYKGLVISNYINARNRDILAKVKFDNYTYDAKLEAVMERLYMDTANEFLLPDMMEKNNSDVSVLMQFKTSIMNLCSQTINPWFTDFIIYNYNVILEEFDPNCANILYDAISMGLLDEPPINKIY